MVGRRTPHPDPLRTGWGEGGTRCILVNRDAEGFAAEEEPEDAEFPVLEAVDLRMGAVVEVVERAGGDEIFPAAFTAGEEERDVGDLLGDDIDGAIHPDDLLVGVRKTGTGGKIGAGKPGGGVEGTGDGWRGGASDVKAEDFHAN